MHLETDHSKGKDGKFITYQIPPEIKEKLETSSPKERALMSLIESYYARNIQIAIRTLREHPSIMDHAGIAIHNSDLVIEVGYGPFFRALQELHSVTLEDIAHNLLHSGWLWSEFVANNITLDVLYSPASDPGPPYDDETDYVIAVVLQGTRGDLPSSRYHK